jgi:hypothetical protein
MDYLVKSWYLDYLGRAATGGEEAGFVAQLMSGATQFQVLSGLLASTEFFARAQTLFRTGSADERYIEALYQVLLNRTGDAAGVASNTLVAQFAGRQVAAQVILESSEFSTHQIEGYYNILLHRTYNSSEIAGWQSSGLDLASVLLDFQSSAEFIANG